MVADAGGRVLEAQHGRAEGGGRCWGKHPRCSTSSDVAEQRAKWRRGNVPNAQRAVVGAGGSVLDTQCRVMWQSRGHEGW